MRRNCIAGADSFVHDVSDPPPAREPRRRRANEKGSSALKRRTLIVFGSVAAAAIAAVTVPLAGRPLLGFQYRAIVDTEHTVCPDWVTAQAGDVITLSTGERFRVRDITPDRLTDALLRSNAFVKIDRQHNWLAVRTPAAPCGMRPEQGQWITIPLRATERVQTYYASDLARIDPLPAPGEDQSAATP
jgi:hypothetical protein